MIVLQMIIINLTVAAVIDGLSSARKDNTGIIKRDEVDDLITLWAEYDPKATGYIDVSSLVFLLFELPKPMGYGSDRDLIHKNNKNTNIKAENDQNITDILSDNLKHMELLKEMVRSGTKFDDYSAMSHKSEQSPQPNKLKHLETIRDKNSMKMLINHERNIVISKYESIKILEHFDIPYYENKKVHFKDIWKKVVENTFENDNQKVEVGPRLRKRIQQGWLKKFDLRKQKKIDIGIQQIMAATVLLKWIRFYIRNKQKRGEKVRQSVLDVEEKVEGDLMKSVDMIEDYDEKEEAHHVVESLMGRGSSVDLHFDHNLNHHNEELEDEESKQIPFRNKNKRNQSIINEEEVDEFIDLNVDVLQSLKISKLKEKPRVKTASKTNFKGKFNTLEDEDKNNVSFILKPTGGFFENIVSKPKYSRKDKLKKMSKKKVEKNMRSTAAFPKFSKNVRESIRLDGSNSKDLDNYSYQQIDDGELNLYSK